MLFLVSTEAAALLSAVPLQNYVTVGFGRLLSSYSDGHHVVIIDPKTCKSIESNLLFSAENRTAAQRIRNRYADYGSLPQKMAFYAKIVDVGIEPLRVAHGWDVPLGWIANNPLLMANLICEDLHDTAVLMEAGKDDLERSKLKAFMIRAFEVPGGGGNTHRVLNQVAVIDQKICLCIVDSDKKSPYGAPGPTAQLCIELGGSGFFKVVLTAGKTIENSLPWRLIDKVRANQPVAPSCVLAAMEQEHEHSSWFLNFKRGLSSYEIYGLASHNCRTFWISGANSRLGTKTCCAENVCDEAESSQCRRRLHSGFGGNLLNDVGTWLKENQQAGRSTNYLPSPNQSDWINLGQLVSAFSLGLQIRRI